MYHIAKCDVIWTICDRISNNTSQILRYKLWQNVSLYCGLIINIFEIIFTNLSQNNVYIQKYTCIFLTKTIKGSARPGLFSVFLDRAGGTSVRPYMVRPSDRTWYVRTWNFNFQQCARIFTATPKILRPYNFPNKFVIIKIKLDHTTKYTRNSLWKAPEHVAVGNLFLRYCFSDRYNNVKKQKTDRGLTLPK